jgi:hypothetical protein
VKSTTPPLTRTLDFLQAELQSRLSSRVYVAGGSGTTHKSAVYLSRDHRHQYSAVWAFSLPSHKGFPVKLGADITESNSIGFKFNHLY